MITSRILPEHIPRILSNKSILEGFLSKLLAKPVRLSRWPTEAAWDDTSPAPDLQAVTEDGMYIFLYVDLFGYAPPVEELANTAVQYFPEPTCTVVLTTSDFSDLGQSYNRIAPMVVDAPVITELDCSWQIHILSCSSKIMNRNAPSEIQHLLDHLSGQKITPAAGSLLDRMLREDFFWCLISDVRSRCKSIVCNYCAMRSAQGVDPGTVRSEAQNIAEHVVSSIDLSELYTKLMQFASRNPCEEELRAFCYHIGIPTALYQDTVTGHPWDIVNLLIWYDDARKEEAQRRNSANKGDE